MSMLWIGIGGLTLGATSIALAATQKPAGSPNLASSSAELSSAEIAMLPIQRQLEAAAQLGQSITLDLPEYKENQQFLKVPNEAGWGYDLIPYNAAEWEGKTLPGEIVSKMVKVKAGPHTFDFAGLGAADIQSKLADANAKTQLALSQKYDPQFIAEALKQEAEANPQGVAARQRMSELIQQQINEPLEQPVAETLNRQVSERLAAGKGLDAFDTEALNRAVSGSLGARGGASPGADFTSPPTTGFEGEQRRLAGIGQATNWLASGETPEDVTYRREQQNMANLSAEISGQTPVSEFSSLSGAQNGPTPVSGSPALPLTPGGVTGAAGGEALNRYGTQLGVAANQANPWMLGMTSTINAAGAAGNMGWKPFA